MSELSNFGDVHKLIGLYHILAERGYQDGIENHCSLIIDRHPRTNKKALITAKYGIDWSTTTINDLLAIDIESKTMITQSDSNTQYDAALYSNMLSIHAGVIQKRDDIKCIIHVHPMSICTLVGLQEPFNKILDVHQNNIRFNYIAKVAYDDEYGGFEFDEYSKFSDLIGAENDIIFLSNHGIVVTADCVELAFDRLYFIDLAAQIQVNIYKTQKDMKCVPERIVRNTVKHWTKEMEKNSAIYHFTAAFNSLKRHRSKL